MRTWEESLAGWGNLPVETCRVAHPESVAVLQQVVTGDPSSTMISRGLGRAYGDAALNRQRLVILHSQLNRFLAFDEQQGILDAVQALGIVPRNQIFDKFAHVLAQGIARRRSEYREGRRG